MGRRVYGRAYGVEATILIPVSRVGRCLRHLCPGFSRFGGFIIGRADLFPENNGCTRGLYAQSDLFAPDIQDGDTDVIPDKEAFPGFSGDN
jgi:hypothetical protein